MANKKAIIGVTLGALALGATAYFIFRPKKSASKERSGVGSDGTAPSSPEAVKAVVSGRGGGAVAPTPNPAPTPTTDDLGNDLRCPELYKLTRAQMLRELNLPLYTPSVGAGAYFTTSGTPASSFSHPKVWVKSMSDSLLRISVQTKRGYKQCGVSVDTSSSFDGRKHKMFA